MLCWHRPRRRIRGEMWTCRSCGVAIVECNCVQWRLVNHKCEFCMGSGWVAFVRGKIATFLEKVS